MSGGWQPRYVSLCYAQLVCVRVCVTGQCLSTSLLFFYIPKQSFWFPYYCHRFAHNRHLLRSHHRWTPDHGPRACGGLC